jgi:hypothetical protein
MAGSPIRRARRMAKLQEEQEAAQEVELQPLVEVTPDSYDAILTDVNGGLAVLASIDKHNVSPRSFYRFKNSSAERVRMYDDARLAGIEAIADSGFKIAANPLMLPDDKRVRLDWIKWFLAKMNPGKYGEKQAVDVRLQGSLSISINTAPPASVTAQTAMPTTITAQIGDAGA